MNASRLVGLGLIASALMPFELSWGQAGGIEFLTVVPYEEISEDVLAEYDLNPVVFRYQVVRIDSEVLREFIRRDSELAAHEEAQAIRFAVFDEDPVEFFGSVFQIFQHDGVEHVSWLGLTADEFPFTCKVTLGRYDRNNIDFESETGNYKIDRIRDLPTYHVLWQWHPDVPLPAPHVIPNKSLDNYLHPDELDREGSTRKREFVN